MGGSFDQKMLQQQQQTDQQQAAQDGQRYNADGSGRANDYHSLPPQQPPPSIPGPSGTVGKDLVVDRARLTAVATQMGSDLNRLQATLQQLFSDGAGGGMVGGWPTANAFGANATNAYSGISQFYQDLNVAYDQVITNIRQAVSNYADAESSTGSAVHGITQPANGSLTPGA